ncbi:MAG: OmpA/MotB domain protein [Bryobacterales bacterium]|nr:OmpA/MotB domain protein [Bryobacterales bacterium]
MNIRTLSAAVFAATLLLAAAGCKKKVAASAPPPPPPKVEEPPPPPPKPQPPRIDTFAAEPATLERGQSSTLRWTVANATNMSIDQGVGAIQANGTRQVSPGNSTTYTLTASGSGGMDTRSVTVTVNAPPPPPPPKPKPTVTISSADMLSREAQDIYFDYDMSDLRADAVRSAMANAELLKRIFAQDPNFSVLIEGHCDERGSAEYNLGLGDRRATSLKDYYVQQGLPANRIRTISYGKERPQCTDANEACYQRNRRDHMSAGQ